MNSKSRTSTSILLATLVVLGAVVAGCESDPVGPALLSEAPDDASGPLDGTESPTVELARVSLENGGLAQFLEIEGDIVVIADEPEGADPVIAPSEVADMDDAVELFERLVPGESAPEALREAQRRVEERRILEATREPIEPELLARGVSEPTWDSSRDSQWSVYYFMRDYCLEASAYDTYLCFYHRTGDYTLDYSSSKKVYTAAKAYRGRLYLKIRKREGWIWKEWKTKTGGWVEQGWTRWMWASSGGRDVWRIQVTQAAGDGYHLTTAQDIY